MAIELTDEIKRNIDIYENVLFDLNNFFVSLGIQQNLVKIYETFCYMVNNDYLSCFYGNYIPPLYEKLEQSKYIPFDISGMMVLAGYGVCRHVSDFLNHVFSRMGYSSSQLFVHAPKLEYKIISDQPLTIEEKQKYVHETLKGFNLLYKCEVAYERMFSNAKVQVHFKPSSEILNHTMNIVKSYLDDTIHIFDVNLYRVGFKTDIDKLIMADLDKPGYTFINLVMDYPDFMTYYCTNYALGIVLFQEFSSSSLESILSEHTSYSESILEFIPEFENFKKVHESQYREVQTNFYELARKLI